MAASVLAASNFYGRDLPRPYLLRHEEYAGSTRLLVQRYTNPASREDRPDGPQAILLDWAGRASWKRGGFAKKAVPSP
eukprot:CAMPEP_0198245764 /NCGR_PEP_ID=MMETSP1446-20131203/42684_1 /TAXON_ID=1461542 ORGANISM="Unidentified sp, Strain CCMP2111" /NCGR_SAMPLE_ID=MMETSP1446 /ASSEMBLY_ACC=CAM_ASM_001112 /LENGTH=77 /DNA_ID=CAMNT_0043929991 /DNA_START=255 /DNA_END=484 /DNA_ORIENTATION=+